MLSYIMHGPLQMILNVVSFCICSINDTEYHQIMQRMVDTKADAGSVHSIAWGVVGPQMVSNAAKQATTDVAAKIQDNSSKYVPTPGGSASGKPYDVSQMSQSQIDDDMMKELEEKMTS